MRWGLLGALCLLVMACSGNGAADDTDRGAEDEGNRDAYVTALAQSYDNPYTTPEHHQCMAEATVDVLGMESLTEAGTADQLREADRLQGFGITPDEATAGELVDALDACVDMRTVLFGDEDALTPEVRSCIEARIPDDLLRRFMISTYTSPTGLSDQPELEAQVTAGREGCRPQATTAPPAP